MMRRTKWSRVKHAAGERTRNRVDRCCLEPLVLGERGKNSRKPSREHRLSRSRRTDEQQVVPTRRRNLERALCRFLPGDIGEIERLFLDRRNVRRQDGRRENAARDVRDIASPRCWRRSCSCTAA